MNTSDYLVGAQEQLGDVPGVWAVLATLGIVAAAVGYRLYKVQRGGSDIGPEEAIAVMPWDVIKYAFQQLRHAQFEVEGDGEGIVVDADIDGIRELLAERHFGPWDKLSYAYKGEDLNMRRMEHSTTNADGERFWWQMHVRAFETDDDYVRLNAHVEMCPIEHPSEHLNEEGFDQQSGLGILRSMLVDADVEIVRDAGS